MRRSILLIGACLFAVAPHAALAKPGHEPVGPIKPALNSTPHIPPGGGTWNVTFSFNDNRGPVEGPLAPVITIRNDATNEVLDFWATHIGGGLYFAKVTFPSAGQWRYELSPYRGERFSYAPVVVRAAAKRVAFPVVPASTAGGMTLLASIVVIGRRLMTRRVQTRAKTANV